jgi:hypothetical protein
VFFLILLGPSRGGGAGAGGPAPTTLALGSVTASATNEAPMPRRRAHNRRRDMHRMGKSMSRIFLPIRSKRRKERAKLPL